MFKSISKVAMTLGAVAAISTGTLAPRPAVAQSQGTINTLLGAAALVGGIILYNNYVHKRQAANSIVGYTANGGTVYGDGRIVLARTDVLTIPIRTVSMRGERRRITARARPLGHIRTTTIAPASGTVRAITDAATRTGMPTSLRATPMAITRTTGIATTTDLHSLKAA